MEKNRKYNRLKTEKSVSLRNEGRQIEVSLLDISPGGMRISSNTDLKINSCVLGQFKVLPDLGPFYVHGEVVWIKPAIEQPATSSGFEAGVKFHKVSTIPL